MLGEFSIWKKLVIYIADIPKHWVLQGNSTLTSAPPNFSDFDQWSVHNNQMKE